MNTIKQQAEEKKAGLLKLDIEAYSDLLLLLVRIIKLLVKYLKIVSVFQIMNDNFPHFHH